MKVKELITKIDIEAVKRSTISCFDLVDELMLDTRVSYDAIEDQTRLFSGFVSVHYCTDTWVGLKIYVFDDEVVAFSSQVGRKCDKVFYWVSEESYKEVKAFCLTLCEPEEEGGINLINMEGDVSSEDGYRLNFSEQMISHIHTTAKIDGEAVKVNGDADPTNRYLSNTVLVEYPDGMVVKEEIGKLLFPYNMLLKG
jgi:hypothetical protein